MMNGLGAMLVLAAVVMPASVAAVTTMHGRVMQTSKAGIDTSAYIEIENSGSIPDVLTAATCSIAVTQLVDRAGQKVTALPIPPGRTRLSASGPHILLRAPRYSIDYGSVLPCSLTFQNAGELLIMLYAEPAGK